MVLRAMLASFLGAPALYLNRATEWLPSPSIDGPLTALHNRAIDDPQLAALMV